MLESSSPRLSVSGGDYLAVQKVLKRFLSIAQDPDGRKIRTSGVDVIAKLTSCKATHSSQIIKKGMGGPCCWEQVKEEGF